jgi:hypothetical protein
LRTSPSRFKQARRRWFQSLEDEANRRAHDGVESPVIYKGKPVFVEGGPLKKHEYSDTLLLALLKAYDPERFKDRTETTLKWSGRLEDLDPEQLDNYLASLKVLIDVEERRLREQPKQLEAGPVVDIQATESSTA